MDNRLKKSIKEVFLEYLNMSDEESDILIERINENLLSEDMSDEELDILIERLNEKVLSKDEEYLEDILQTDEVLRVGDVLENSHGLWVVTDVDSEGSLLDTQFLDDYLCDNEKIYNLNGEYKTISELIKERKELYLSKSKVHKIYD